jgi:hypothetical protein
LHNAIFWFIVAHHCTESQFSSRLFGCTDGFLWVRCGMTAPILGRDVAYYSGWDANHLAQQRTNAGSSLRVPGQIHTDCPSPSPRKG